MKKALSFITASVVALSVLSGCAEQTVESGAKTKEGNIMIESFDDSKFTAESFTNAELTSKNAEQGKAALVVSSSSPVGNPDNVGAQVTVNLKNPVNAADYKYFKINVYSEDELSSGHLDIALLKSADYEQGYNFRRHCNLKKGANEIYFSA